MNKITIESPDGEISFEEYTKDEFLITLIVGDMAEIKEVLPINKKKLINALEKLKK